MRNVTGVLLILALPSPALADPHLQQITRPDGTVIHYTLDRPANPEGLFVLAQGSGCSPGAQSQGLATFRAAFPSYAALIVEKAGISPDMTVDENDCPTEYLKRYTLSQRIEDYHLVLAALEPIAGNLILMGGSEGGMAVSILAAQLDPDRTIILSSATGNTFAEMILDTVPPQGHDQVKAGFDAARANPDSSALFIGHTQRFWADSLDHRSLDYLLETESPILLIQGGRDTSGPVASARLTTDAFAGAGRCNLTYWEFPSLDHAMADPSGQSHMATIAAQAAAWIATPVTSC